MHRQYRRPSTFLVDGDYPEESVETFLSLPVSKRRQFHCISGHIPFGLHRYLPQHAVYTTVMRDPVERVLSLYYHVLRETTHYMHDTVVSKNMSLLDFAASRLSRELSNDQIRIVSGICDWDQQIDQTAIDEAAFQKAIANIERFFPVVGLTERFDASLLLMKDAFSWKSVFYSRRKVTSSRPKKKDIDPRAVEAINSQNQYDRLLYDYAKQRLQRQIDERGRYFQYRLQWFKRANRVYNYLRSKKQTPPVSFLWSAAKVAALFRTSHKV